MASKKIPARALTEVRPPTSRFRCIDLSEEVTNAFFTHPSKLIKTYALLHKSGEFVMSEHGPVVTSTWAQIAQQADAHGCDFIVNFHDETIRHRRRMPNGGFIWDRAIFFPHPCARDLPNHVESFKGADEHGRSRTSLLKATRRKKERT